MNHAEALVAADRALESGSDREAADAFDTALWFDFDPALATLRDEVLERLALEVHGMAFRYVPGGPVELGSHDGPADERPVHVRRLDGFWMAVRPLSWADCSRLHGLPPPPDFAPPRGLEGHARFDFVEGHQIREQYCDGPDAPAVAMTWNEVSRLVGELSSESVDGVELRLAVPSEAQWEKAARGGLRGARYPWGDEAPTRARCDSDRYGDFRSLRPPDSPNGYGLVAMSGTVAEWTSDVYDALAYRGEAPELPEQVMRVTRGGSWADCAAACTVSFRDARNPDTFDPTVGVRLIAVSL